MLGTAQLGLAYGVANTTGRPDFHQAVRLIAAAAEGGVNCFDTAAAYGDMRIGRKRRARSFSRARCA